MYNMTEPEKSVWLRIEFVQGLANATGGTVLPPSALPVAFTILRAKDASRLAIHGRASPTSFLRREEMGTS